MMEYGLLVALIALICVASIAYLGGDVATIFQDTADGLGNAPPECPSGTAWDPVLGFCGEAGPPP